jgi:hypothetical protein
MWAGSRLWGCGIVVAATLAKQSLGCRTANPCLVSAKAQKLKRIVVASALACQAARKTASLSARNFDPSVGRGDQGRIRPAAWACPSSEPLWVDREGRPRAKEGTGEQGMGLRPQEAHVQQLPTPPDLTPCGCGQGSEGARDGKGGTLPHVSGGQGHRRNTSPRGRRLSFAQGLWWLGPPKQNSLTTAARRP